MLRGARWVLGSRRSSGLSRLAKAFADSGNVPLRDLLALVDRTDSSLTEATRMAQTDPDPAVRELAAGELQAAVDARAELDIQMEHALRCAAAELAEGSDPGTRTRSVLVEVRPGAGGAESAAFVEQLAAMYARLASQKKWTCRDLLPPGSQKRFLKISEPYLPGAVFNRMKHEAGVHRVQRVPESESTGRVHSSTVSVVVLPAPDSVSASDNDVVIDPNEIRLDLFRASGAGGQHVNKTESAVRITHLPTSITVSCQDQRSQFQNKERAMKQLVAQLSARKEAEGIAQSAAARRAQLGAVPGERSDRVRTYNFLQGRVTDHRVKGLSVHGPVDRFMSSVDGLETIMDRLDEMQASEALGKVLANYDRDGTLTAV